jgi:hypothetical protein
MPSSGMISCTAAILPMLARASRVTPALWACGHVVEGHQVS